MIEATLEQLAKLGQSYDKGSATENKAQNENNQIYFSWLNSGNNKL
jgi:hypothetical protein